MKYIKKYEKVERFRDYIILNNPSHLLLFKLKDFSQNTTTVQKLYVYDKQNQKTIELVNMSGENFNQGETQRIEPKIIYQSNDLQECIDRLPILANAMKYNL